ncbi:hypothetical protein Tco_1036200 [Tanacetum coccineum]
MATVVTDKAETNGANSEIVEKMTTFTVVKSQVLWKQRRVEGSSNEANILRMMCSCQEDVLMLDSDVRVED